MPHTALPGYITPYQRFTGRRPDLTHIRVFGSHVTVKQPRVRLNKLDTTHTTTGIFLGFTSTDRTIWFEDHTTGELKSARHVTFDEAHYTPNNRPPYAQELMNLAEEHLSNPSEISPPPSLPLHLIPDLDKPDENIPSLIEKPTNTAATVVPPPDPQHIQSPTPDTTTPHLTDAHLIPPDTDDDISPLIRSTATEKPIDFELTSNPFGSSVDITILLKGDHPTLGLDLVHDDDNNRITLASCISSTPAARIPRWRSTLRHATIVAIDHVPINTIDDIKSSITSSRSSSAKHTTITFMPLEHVNIRPDTNIPQIHFDQLNVIAHQHSAARKIHQPGPTPITLPLLMTP